MINLTAPPTATFWEVPPLCLFDQRTTWLGKPSSDVLGSNLTLSFCQEPVTRLRRELSLRFTLVPFSALSLFPLSSFLRQGRKKSSSSRGNDQLEAGTHTEKGGSPTAIILTTQSTMEGTVLLLLLLRAF